MGNIIKIQKQFDSKYTLINAQKSDGGNDKTHDVTQTVSDIEDDIRREGYSWNEEYSTVQVERDGYIITDVFTK